MHPPFSKALCQATQWPLCVVRVFRAPIPDVPEQSKIRLAMLSVAIIYLLSNTANVIRLMHTSSCCSFTILISQT